MVKKYEKKPPQICSSEGCNNIAAYKTNSKAAYCLECINKIYEKANLELIDKFNKPNDFYITKCKICGESAHYRFNYVLEKLPNIETEPICHACKWTKWYKNLPWYNPELLFTKINENELKKIALNNNSTLVEIIYGELPGQELYVTKCNKCGFTQINRELHTDHKCLSTEKTMDVIKRSKPKAEMSYKITEWQKLGAREFQDKIYLYMLPNKKGWDFNKNINDLLESETIKSEKDAYFICSNCHNSFLSKINKQNISEPLCNKCSKDLFKYDYSKVDKYKNSTVAEVPELEKYWNYEINPDPSTIKATGGGLYKWKCKEGHNPCQTPYNYLVYGCSSCRNLRRKKMNKDRNKNNKIPDSVPIEMRDQWHPTKNSYWEYGKHVLGKKAQLWWKCNHCGHEWEECIRDRERIQNMGGLAHNPYCRCPECGGTLDSLAWHYPSLAKEWSINNPDSAWDIRPTGKLTYIPEWVCSNNNKHVWPMKTTTRINGGSCPECKEQGKSKIELLYFNELKNTWKNYKVISGAIINNPNFSHSWTADILICSKISVIIEYDGSYWHDDKYDIDTLKTNELLEAGYKVCRIRELDLNLLNINNKNYYQVNVNPSHTIDINILNNINEWIKKQN